MKRTKGMRFVRQNKEEELHWQEVVMWDVWHSKDIRAEGPRER